MYFEVIHDLLHPDATPSMDGEGVGGVEAQPFTDQASGLALLARAMAARKERAQPDCAHTLMQIGLSDVSGAHRTSNHRVRESEGELGSVPQ